MLSRRAWETFVVSAGIAALSSMSVTRVSRAPGVIPLVAVQGPIGDPLLSAIPLFIIRAADLDALDRPAILTLQVSERSDFAGALLFERSVQGDSARISTDRPLPEGRSIFWRARLHTARGEDFFSTADGPRSTATWLRLISPNPTLGGTLESPRPQFVWSAAGVPFPPGPWHFFLSVENLGSRRSINFGPLVDSTFLLPVDLETNTSYRWSVTAALATGDTTTVRSPSSFVIADQSAPKVTLLYQNFPNPFPTATATSTCIWFDLHRPSHVRLTIHDIRGAAVRTLIPNQVVSGDLPPGRFGRGAPGTTEGCDPELIWDGRADDGRLVPTGVYLLRLKTETYEAFKKILFRGR
jgi:hypothetical protein